MTDINSEWDLIFNPFTTNGDRLPVLVNILNDDEMGLNQTNKTIL
jgi:hypothetical protein